MGCRRASGKPALYPASRDHAPQDNSPTWDGSMRPPARFVQAHSICSPLTLSPLSLSFLYGNHLYDTQIPFIFNSSRDRVRSCASTRTHTPLNRWSSTNLIYSTRKWISASEEDSRLQRRHLRAQIFDAKYHRAGERCIHAIELSNHPRGEREAGLCSPQGSLFRGSILVSGTDFERGCANQQHPSS